jgi:hypothetical protein
MISSLLPHFGPKPKGILRPLGIFWNLCGVAAEQPFSL